jgi:hypothetical protein
MKLDNLSNGENDINEKDFLDRVNLLSSLNQMVMVTNFREYYRLSEYFSRFTKERMGLIIGTNHLIKLFDESYYQHLSGGILEAMGKLFNKKMKLYIYPYKERGQDETICSRNVKLPKKMQDLFDYFKNDGRFEDLSDYDQNLLKTYNRELIEKIQKGIEGWEKYVPDAIADQIKNNNLFGYKRLNY